MPSRRLFITGAAGLIAMPAVVRAESLMKIIAPKRRLLVRLEEAVTWSVAQFNGDFYFMGADGFYRMDGRTRMLELIPGS